MDLIGSILKNGQGAPITHTEGADVRMGTPLQLQKDNTAFSQKDIITSSGDTSHLNSKPADSTPSQDTSTTSPSNVEKKLGEGVTPDNPSSTSEHLFPTPTQDVREVIPPNRTLYVNNLNSKIKLPQLKKDLEAIFSNFGVVRQIVAMSSFWRRGQGWIVFADQESADKALIQLQGFPYANKEMRIQYAREVSDIFSKEAGTFVKRPPGPKKPRAIIEREKKLQSQLQQFQRMVLQHMHQQQYVGGDGQGQTLTQSMQAASAIAAQVQQVMQQPSLMAMFPNAAAGPNNGAAHLQQQQQQPPHIGHQYPHNSFQPVHSVASYNPGSGYLPQAQANFQSMGGGRQNSSGPNLMPGLHSSRQDKVMVGGQQSYGINAGMMMGRGLPALNGVPHDMKAVPPPASMSKDAVVAAAAAAAAAAISAAKKRVLENHSANKSTSMASRHMANNFNSNETKVTGFPPLSNAGDTNASANGAPLGMYSSNSVPTPTGYSIGTYIPNKTLCVEELPEDCNTKTLEMIFKQYPGCVDIRHMSSRGVAFVDYESVAQSTAALGALNHFPIKENHFIKISYAQQ